MWETGGGGVITELSSPHGSAFFAMAMVNRGIHSDTHQCFKFISSYNYTKTIFIHLNNRSTQFNSY